VTQVCSRKPSLDDAYARIRRAKQHLARFKRELAAFWGDEGRRLWIPNATTGIFEEQATPDLVPPTFGILVGECIYNLRAALDYLIYELAILDSGKIQERTQFPIEDTVKRWKTKCASRLKGLSVVHQACIERLQPCFGCKWTANSGTSPILTSTEVW